MNKIVKTKAVVLKKINYGDTSIIASLYSEELGRISAILKGARKSKSKPGLIIDPINIVEIVLYNKSNREIQLISSADLLSNYLNIKEDIEKLKYAYATIELIQNLTIEGEKDLRLFKGLVKILELFNTSKEFTGVIFCRFFFFFIKELGYQFSLKKCTVCGREDISKEDLGFNFETGLLCSNCKKNNISTAEINQELFNFFTCLSNNKKISNNVKNLSSKAVYFMESYLKYHINTFTGLKSIKLID
ncbi:MAG: DNA repair protein RecO [Bacteroidetes bacterium]|nr:DNA repair protein RecO [Bacteroidota bacterium]MCH8326777.1 DNA repair protein RecO [Bacteroidota bacterium]